MGLENPIHLLLLLVVVLLVFGAKRLPEMGRSLGHGLRGFKEAIGGEEPEVHHLHTTTPAPVAPVATETAAPETAAPITTATTSVAAPDSTSPHDSTLAS